MNNEQKQAMDTPWTPGPLELNGYTDCQLLTKDRPVMHGSPIPVGRTYGPNMIADGRLFANASEIAAALADLLVDVDHEIEQRQHSGNDEDWAALQEKSNRAHTALAKARGEDV